ncbi:hypothetical protein GGR57DRAFT_205205 [Xylariaceae sp. FL1272]|nr:hypothetical protein GGR57DRAFT_205205 [Xylariaceae sp. FL1272]
MGRTEQTVVKPPQAFRRDARAKRARNTLNKVIPSLLIAHPRAKRGIERSELILDPPPFTTGQGCPSQGEGLQRGGQDDTEDRKTTQAKGRRKKDKSIDETHSNHEPLKATPLPRPTNPNIEIRALDTLTAAHALQHPKTKVGILNMASPLSPGGGFLNGATSQEESLCMRTTLLPSLHDSYYRLPELGIVYTPDVLVFRHASSLSQTGEEDDILPKTQRWHVDIVSAAMLRLPEVEDGAYANPADRELVTRKMRAVMRVFASKGCKKVVLGAWGCGAYGNPGSEIASAWRRVLGRQGQRGKKGAKLNGGDREEWQTYFEDIVFAIKDPNLALAFAKAFGEENLTSPFVEGQDVDEGSEESADSQGERELELRAKIRELETQLHQVRSPHLRTGLESVLASLRSQLGLITGDNDADERSLDKAESGSEEEDDDENNDDQEADDDLDAYSNDSENAER